MSKEQENVIKISIILIDYGTQVMRYRLEKKMNGKVFDFFQNHWIRIQTKPFLKAVWDKIVEINQNFPGPDPINNKLIPNNLDEFDLSSCYSILRNLTHERPMNPYGNDDLDTMDQNDNSLAANFNRLRLIRNMNFGHLVAFKMNDSDYNKYIIILKQRILELCDRQNMKKDYEKKINSVLSSCYNYNEMLIIYEKYKQKIIDLMIGHRDDLIKTIEELNETNGEIKQEIQHLKDLLINSNDNVEIKKMLKKIIENKEVMKTKLDEINSGISALKIQTKNLEHGQEVIKTMVTNLKDDKLLMGLSSYIPHEKITNFIRKEELFKEIEEIFSKESNKFVIISGYAGSGKTTLASNYGQEQKHKNKKIVRWFSAESKNSVWSAYINMATHELGIGNDIDDKKVIINLVNKDLKTLENILFIFDNVKDANDIKELIINLPNNVQTIVTTKNNNLKDNFEFGNESNLEMKPFNKNECIEYIIKLNKKRKFNQFQAEKIIDLIKTNEKEEIYIFKLSKVMALLQTESWTIEVYGKTKEHGEIEIKAEDYLLKELINESPNGWKLLQHCIYLDENFISMDILEEILTDNNEIDIHKEKEALEELSLVNQIQLENGKEFIIGIKIHSIIKDTIEKYIKQEKNNKMCIEKMKILENLINVINSKMLEIDDMPNNDWDQAEIYYRHAHKLINLKLEQEIQSNQNLADLYSKIAKYEQHKLCNLENLIKYYENNLKILKTLHKGNHPDVARSLGNVGYSYSKSENRQKGLEYSKQALIMYQDLYRDSHSGYHKDVAESLNGVGYSYNRLNEPQKALEYFKEALEIYQTLYKCNHPNVARSLDKISLTYNKLGDEQNRMKNYELGLENYKQGLEYSKQALKIYQNLDKDSHPHVLAKLLASLGISYNKTKDTQKGLEYAEQALKMYQDLYKDNHPHVARLLGNVGYSYNQLGNAQKGLEYSEQALKMYQDLYKDNHFDIAKSLGQVGDSYDKLGNYEQALEKHEQSLKIYQYLYKNNDGRVAKSMKAVAFCYKKLGNDQKFQEYMGYGSKMSHASERNPSGNTV